MFEHFGILDIFSGIKKYRYAFCIIIWGFSGLFMALNVLKIKNLAKNIYKYPDYIYLSATSYYVEPKVDAMINADISGVYSYIPDNYIALLNTDFCRQYLYDRLSKMYSDEFIIANSAIPEDSNLDISLIKELYHAQKAQGTMVLEVSSMTYDAELSRSVCDILADFLDSNVSDKISISSLKHSGHAQRAIKSSEIGLENIDKDDKRKIVQPSTKMKYTLRSFVKSVIVPIFMVVILLIGVIVVMGLFNPTFNRASDFARYDVPVIGEIKNYKKFKEGK